MPYDPESKGGAEHTVKIAKADLVPTSANLLPAYARFADLADACFEWCQRVNARPHRETKAAPVDRLVIERRQLHPVPAGPHQMALGEQRLVDEKDQTIRFGSVRYSTPPGYQGATVWCRVIGEELVIIGGSSAGLAEIARHQLSTPGQSADRRRALPEPSRWQPSPAAQAPATHRRRGRVPRPGRRCAPVAG